MAGGGVSPTHCRICRWRETYFGGVHISSGHSDLRQRLIFIGSRSRTDDSRKFAARLGLRDRRGFGELLFRDFDRVSRPDSGRRKLAVYDASARPEQF